MTSISLPSSRISPLSLRPRKASLLSSTFYSPRRRSKSFQFPSYAPHPSSSKTLVKFSSQQQSTEEFERLFSNLNQATMKRKPGSVTSGIFLVAGTTVGARIIAIPAVTQDAGFLASAVTCILCWIYMVVTELLIAEVNENTLCEPGSGGVSLDMVFKDKCIVYVCAGTWSVSLWKDMVFKDN